MPLLLGNLGECSEGEGTLDLAHVVLQDGVRAERLREVETVLNLETLAHRALLGAGAHGARRDPLGVSNLDPGPADVAADPLLPQVEVDGGQGGAGHPRVEERVGDVKHGPLDVSHPVAVVAGDLRQRDLSDLVELRFRESDERVSSFVPEPVALSEVSELDADDAGECWSHQSTVQRRF